MKALCLFEENALVNHQILQSRDSREVRVGKWGNCAVSRLKASESLQLCSSRRILGLGDGFDGVFLHSQLANNSLVCLLQSKLSL